MRKALKTGCICVMSVLIVLSGAGYSRAQEYFQRDKKTSPDPAQTGKLPLFDKELDYDIYYEVSAYEVHRVENIRIIDVVGINSVPFIVVQYSGYASRLGYIKLSSIQAILPTRAPKPNRSIDMLKQYQ